MTELRERFLERLIREFFVRKGSGFVMKGGGALRTLFAEQRLTKDLDLDFTNPKRTAESLHNAVDRAIAAAARGLPIVGLRVSVHRKGELSPRWKINLHGTGGESVHLEIEVSRDPDRAPPGRVVQKAFSPKAAVGIGRFWVDVYDEPTLIATKLAALLGRAVPRDVYDLDLLMSGQPPRREQVQWAIGRAGPGRDDPVAVVRAHVDELSWERFVSELRDSLPEGTAERLDEAEWQAMKARVAAYTERLLASSGPDA